jgi:protein O-mannosyl-transferase
MKRGARKKTTTVATKSETRARWSRNWLWGVLLAAAAIIVYAPAWKAGYIWDDDIYVTANQLLTAPDGLRRIWFSLESPSQYFPLVYTTFRFERLLWGLNPTGYHLVNIALHAANSVLVWMCLRALRTPGAWLGAALWALHPAQVESVAWITERKNVLMGFFFLLTLLSWIKFLDESGPPKWRFYGAAIFFYAFALFSKTTACTLPAALLLILWLQKRPVTWQRVLQICPFVACGIVMGLVTIWWERYHQGTQGQLFALGITERLLIASHAFWFYLGKLFWPMKLLFIYPRWRVPGALAFDYLWGVALGGLAVLIWYLRRYVGRGLEVAALFFLLTLGPVLGFIMLYTFRYSFVADHYQYLACVGPLAMVGAGIVKAERFVSAGTVRFYRAVVPGLLLILLGALTWNQSRMYRDNDVLWDTTIREEPHSWMPRTNKAFALLQQGRMEEAFDWFRQSLQENPEQAEVYNTMALARVRSGRIYEAFEYLNKALELEPDRPDILWNAAGAHLELGHIDQASDYLQRALKSMPHYVPALTDYGLILLQKGRTEEAIEYLRRALRFDPNFQSARYYLGNALLQVRRPQEAVTEFQTMLSKNPDDLNALKNLAWILATWPDSSVRDGARAVELAERANKLSNGRRPMIVLTLAAAYAEAGRFSDATNAAETALQVVQSAGDTKMAEGIRAYIQLYQAGQPFRDLQAQQTPAGN